MCVCVNSSRLSCEMVNIDIDHKNLRHQLGFWISLTGSKQGREKPVAVRQSFSAKHFTHFLTSFALIKFV